MAFKRKLNYYKLFILFFAVILFFVSLGKSFASSYVLPYPSDMPGSKFYAIGQIIEEVERIWFFGDFSQFHYNLKNSDKYLVQAKTLIEYNQFLLANEAVKRSDEFFISSKKNLKNASNKKKPTGEKRALLRRAAEKHIQVLSESLEKAPEEFDWVPEKEKPTKLFLKRQIKNSIRIRNYE